MGQSKMGIESRLLATMFGAFMAVSLGSPSVALAEAVAKSSAPVARPAHVAKAPASSSATRQAATKTASAAHSAKPVVKPHTSSKPQHVSTGSSKAHASTAVRTAAVSSKAPAVPRAAEASAVTVAALAPEEVKAAVARSSAVTRSRPGRIWCVPFAREVSGINIQGNAKTWWNQAGETYPKGQSPVVGSVLNFRSTKKMPLGHVAVVSKVVSPRKILVDHANWSRNRVSLDMAVVDVSANNDWSAVRVESLPNTLGDVYPTYGFIYRPAGRG